MDPLEFVYKRVDTLELKLDVYLPPGASEAQPAPICIWWHGGGRKSDLLLSMVQELRHQYFRYVQFLLSLNEADMSTGNEKAWVFHIVKKGI